MPSYNAKVQESSPLTGSHECTKLHPLSALPKASRGIRREAVCMGASVFLTAEGSTPPTVLCGAQVGPLAEAGVEMLASERSASGLPAWFQPQRFLEPAFDEDAYVADLRRFVRHISHPSPLRLFPPLVLSNSGAHLQCRRLPCGPAPLNAPYSPPFWTVHGAYR